MKHAISVCRGFLLCLPAKVCNIGMLRDYRAQLRELKATAKQEESGGGDAGAENVDPGAARGGRSCELCDWVVGL